MKTRKRPLTHLAAAAGAMWLLTATAAAQDLIHHWTSDNTFWKAQGDMFGTCVSWIGDLDGDGVADAVVSAPREDQVGFWQYGAIYAISGATGADLYKVVGDQKDAKFGNFLAAGADFDGDGVGDFITGTGFYKKNGLMPGAAFVYSGATGDRLYEYYGENDADFFGVCVATLGDVDFDGREDFAVGSTAFDVPPLIGQCGRIYVYSGATGNLIYTLTGTKADETMGFVFGLGDLNGDGVRDIGVGAYAWGAGSNGQGRFDVVDGPTGSVIYSLEGEVYGDNFGNGAAGLGDIDADGVEDFMVDAPAHTTNPGSGSDSEGRVYVYSGASGALLYQYDGATKGEKMGWLPRVGRIDFNADGWPDILIGSALRPTSPSDRGVVLVYSGRTGSLLYEFNRLNGVPISGTLGGSLSYAGDMNGDGIDDLVVGAPNQLKDSQSAAGAAYVFAGNDLFLQSNAYEYSAGDAIELDIRGGGPGDLALLALVAVNGSPAFIPILVNRLDSNGDLTLSDLAPSGLSGLTLTFKGFAQRSLNLAVIDTSKETITFK